MWLVEFSRSNLYPCWITVVTGKIYRNLWVRIVSFVELLFKIYSIFPNFFWGRLKNYLHWKFTWKLHNDWMPSFHSLILQTCLFTQGWNTSRRIFVADDLHHQCFFQTEFCFWSLNINGQRVFIVNLLDVSLGSFTLFEFSRVSIVTILKVSTCSKTTKFFCQDFALPYKNACLVPFMWNSIHRYCLGLW